MPVQKKDRDTTWTIDSNNKTWTLAENAKISVTDQHGISENGYEGSRIRVLGDITVKGDNFAGVYMTGEQSSVLVGDHSRINAKQADYGIRSEDSFVKITNRGTVDGGYYGVSSGSDNTVRNFGSISGQHGVYSGSESRIINHGDIHGVEEGINVEGYGYVRNEKGGVISSEHTALKFETSGLMEIVNKGLIRSDDVAIDGADQVKVTNYGRIVGDIAFGEFEDRLDTRNGVIKGDVYGGGGDDIYFVGKSAVNIIEDAGGSGGHDRVSSTAGHLLKANVEDLFLLGSKNIDGAGNASDNYMRGNSGDNNLFGLAGSDFLSGKGGNDRLTGGGMDDVFEFIGNFGTDRITDFENGIDKLKIGGITSQQDLDALDIHEKNGDLYIELGHGDRVIIDDMLLSDLSYQDFSQT